MVTAMFKKALGDSLFPLLSMTKMIALCVLGNKYCAPLTHFYGFQDNCYMNQQFE